MAAENAAGTASSGPDRRIGPVGTGARCTGGLAAIVVPSAMSSVTWWDIGVALVALPLTATLAATAIAGAYGRYAPQHPRPSKAESWIRSSLTLAIVIGVEIALTFATPLDGAVAIWIFIGLSVLLAAVRGDAGCEAIAIPNALSGRRDPTGYVIFGVIDAAEAKHAQFES